MSNKTMGRWVRKYIAFWRTAEGSKGETSRSQVGKSPGATHQKLADQHTGISHPPEINSIFDSLIKV